MSARLVLSSLPLLVCALAVILLAVLGACSGESEREPSPTENSNPVTATRIQLDPAGPPVVLASEAVASWRLRELQHVPPHFQLTGWKDAFTLWGRARCKPVEVRVDAPELTTWDVEACGDLAPSPDGRTLAWADGRGAILAGSHDEPPQLLLDHATPSPAGEGDPTGRILWSPDGRRILTSWAVEWDAFHALIDVETQALAPISTRIEGYFLTSAWNWIDASRVLFTTQASRDREGRSSYSESGGHRGDLAVYDEATGSYGLVTAVADGVFLRLLARWGDGEVLVGQAGRDRQHMHRYWIYATRHWSRRPLELPPGARVVYGDATSAIVLEEQPQPENGGRGAVRLLLWRNGVAEPLAIMRREQSELAWSPDGERLAVTGTRDEPVPHAPGSFVTRSMTFVIEPSRP